MKRLVMLIALPVAALLTFAAPAGASTHGTVTAPRTASIPCAVSPGHYCAKVFYKSVSGGIRVVETKSTGYTRGPGRGREWFRYSCTAGTCFILPSALFVYSGADVQLNVTRKFGGGGFFLPCGNVFGVQYRNPAVNAPGPGFVKFRVICSRAAHGVTRA
jgi:hypothetical protein